MKAIILRSDIAKLLKAAASLLLFVSLTPAAVAQAPVSSPPQTGKAGAAIDLTGYWVSIINEDWRWRMVTPEKGDFVSLPLNSKGNEVGNSWNESQAGSCQAYGATGIMRMPLRLHISWESDDVLKIDSDAGRQTRRFNFNQVRPEDVQSSLQGYSEADWEYTLSQISGIGFGFPREGNSSSGGTLKVMTTDLEPAWLRRNGAPSSENAVITEYFDTFPAPDGSEWFVVTVIVSDPEYLTEDYVTSSHFRREANAAKWNPTPCQ